MSRAFNFLNFEWVAILMGSNFKRFYCLGFKQPGHLPHLQVTALFLMRVFCKKMYGLFAGPKKVAITTRRLYYQGGRKAGFHYIMDSLLCPWAKRAITFTLISANLIRTLSLAPSVSMLTRFDCMCANSSASSGPHNVISLEISLPGSLQMKCMDP